MIVPDLGGVVLCGGRSARMGTPKAWLDFGGEPLLTRVVRRVAEAAAPVVVVAAPDQSLPELPPGVLVARDDIADRGPLQGIRSGLAALAGLPAPPKAAFVSSTDVPFLAPEIIRRLEAMRASQEPSARIAVARTAGRFHPLCAVYALDVLHHIDELLAADRLRPFFLFERVATVIADEQLLLADTALTAADPSLRSLENVNTPDDYQAAIKSR